MKIRFLRAAASRGCNDLVSRLKSEGHDVKKLLINGSSYRGYPTHLIINWGSSSRRDIREDIDIINKPPAVAIASDKILTFSKLTQNGMSNNVPRWTTNKSEAIEMIEEESEVIYCRGLTRASQGRGITIARSAEEIVDAPLYTAKVDVDRELRVHVFRDRVIDFAQKKKMNSERREEEGITINEEIRSHNNGWVFAREGVSISDEVAEIAIKAVKNLGLNFGAVDMAITPQGVVKIYEINTAPGLEGTTLDRYTEAVLSLC